MPTPAAATDQRHHQREPGIQPVSGCWLIKIRYHESTHPQPSSAGSTHHGAVGFHTAESRQGVLGIDRHNHLAAGLVPVLPARHRLLVLPGRGTHHSMASSPSTPQTEGISVLEDAPLNISTAECWLRLYQLSKIKLCLLCRFWRGGGSCEGGQPLPGCPMKYGASVLCLGLLQKVMLRPETSPSCSRITLLCPSCGMPQALCTVRKLGLEGSAGAVAGHGSWHHAKFGRQMSPNWPHFTFLP